LFAYKVKISGTTYLFGGANVARVADVPLCLVLRVAEGDERVELFVSDKPHGKGLALGTLEPGQSFAISLHDIAAVWATTTAPLDTIVDCLILATAK
jgi:hypothetical protein